MTAVASKPVVVEPGASTAHSAGVRGLLQRQCKCGSSEPNISGTCGECAAKRLQPKLAIGSAHDRYEQEADRVADAVMQTPPAGPGVARAISRVVQRAPAAAAAMRSAVVPRQVESVIATSGQPLDAATRAFFEPRFGHDFGRVRVHHDAAAAASARAVDAIAYTVGEHVVFDAGRYTPASRAGGRLLAHELTHVVQQQGDVLRRASISAPLEGEFSSDEDREGARKPTAPEPEPRRLLQRVPAIVGLDEAGPKADLTGRDEGRKLERIAECMKGKGPDPGECIPKGVPTWPDFSAMADMASPFGAVTEFNLLGADVPSQQCADEVLGHPTAPQRIFQGLFVPASSWVKPNVRDAADPAKNGSAAVAAQCRTAFDNQAAQNQHGGVFRLTPPTPNNCPASAAPAGTPAATKAECATVIVTDFTNTAKAESARLLKHEQNHHKLTCAMAAKGNGLLRRGVSFTVIDAKIRATLSDTQRRYDDESHHGCNAGNQAKWETEIADGLPSVVLP
jgi:hypothetical protein